MEYTNFKGQKTNFKEVTHSHLSNIYWYNKICNQVSESSLSFITKEIDERFNGVILPYNPQWEFQDEIKFLERNRYFSWNQEKTKADIVYLGQVVGFYETPEFTRNEKIKKILE